jgi:hypothetical protein
MLTPLPECELFIDYTTVYAVNQTVLWIIAAYFIEE